MNMQTTARGRAVATQEAAIAGNVAKIEAAKPRPSALEAMSARLNVSPGSLTSTLKNTVFKGASDSEFVALVVVSNAYGLNPLLKEIFAFPAKGGGIIPVVSVDGWVRIMNEHPMFDGIEFNDIVDETGALYAIEAVIYRKDRARPIKVTEYMDECKGTGPAWQKTPKRMLRHRALIQDARVAFGFSGIYAEGDEPAQYIQQDGGETARQATPPRRQEYITHDAETGEIEADELEEDEETARRLDREIENAREGRSDEQHGDQHDGTADDDAPAAYQAMVDDTIARVTGAQMLGDVLTAEADFNKHRAALPDDVIAAVEAEISAGKLRFKRGAAK